MPKTRRRAALLALLLASAPLGLGSFAQVPSAAPAAGGAAAANPGDYRLGAQDRLSIRVHTLRKAVGEAYPWASLTGEFTVGASGALSMPIIGEVPADGLTTAELGQRISESLKATVGLTDIPSTSVEVVRYRPFFVLGAVEEPGRYEFQPGLTVLQALGTAKGLVRAEDMSGNERAGIDADGEMRRLGAERIALLARLARFEAETRAAEAIAVPAELAAMTADERAGAAMADERMRFETRRRALATDLEAAGESKSFFEEELQSLSAKAASVDRQAELTGQELRDVSDLVRKGIAVAPRQLAAESSQLSVEGNRLDLQVELVRARQGLTQATRELAEAPERYRREAVDGAAETRALLEENTARLATAERLLSYLEARSPGMERDGERLRPRFELTRTEGGTSRTLAASESDLVRPGDVLTVTLARETATAAPAAAAPAEPAAATGPEAEAEAHPSHEAAATAKTRSR